MTEAQQQKPLTEHLIELRKRLFYAIVALVIASGVAFVFRNEIFEFLDARKLHDVQTKLCRRFSDKFPIQGKPLPSYEVLWKKLCFRRL